MKIIFYKKDTENQRNKKLNYFHEIFNKNLINNDFEIIINNKRTLKQNSSLHLYFEMVSKELNEAGLDFQKIFKNPTAIIITPLIVKECMWRPIQKAMFNTKSTTKLSKTKQIEMIYDVLNKKLSEFGIYVQFPNK